MDPEDIEYLLKLQRADDPEIRALREAQAKRDRQGHITASTQRSGEPDDLIARFRPFYKKNVAQREVPEARERQVATRQLETITDVSAVQTSPASRRNPRPRKLANAPIGIFLLALKKGEFTWKLQLFGVERADGNKTPLLRFQLWSAGEGGHPIKEGPGCGFSLDMKEASALLDALTNGIRQVRSGEFNPSVEGNYLPHRQGK